MAVSRGKFCSLSALCTHCYHCAHSSEPENPIGKKEVLVKHTFSGEENDLLRYLKEEQLDFLPSFLSQSEMFSFHWEKGGLKICRKDDFICI